MKTGRLIKKGYSFLINAIKRHFVELVIMSGTFVLIFVILRVCANSRRPWLVEKIEYDLLISFITAIVIPMAGLLKRRIRVVRQVNKAINNITEKLYITGCLNACISIKAGHSFSASLDSWYSICKNSIMNMDAAEFENMYNTLYIKQLRILKDALESFLREFHLNPCDDLSELFERYLLDDDDINIISHVQVIDLVYCNSKCNNLSETRRREEVLQCLLEIKDMIYKSKSMAQYARNTIDEDTIKEMSSLYSCYIMCE